jgi:quinol monooxygenase YgiN
VKPNDTLRLIAIIKSKPEQIEATRAMLAGLVEPTRREPGCISYELLLNREDPTEFVFVEEWTDEAALAAHFETDHLKAALRIFPELAAAPLDLRKYRLVG